MPVERHSTAIISLATVISNPSSLGVPFTLPPSYPARVYVKGVALLNMVIEHSRKQIVCRAYGMEIAGEVQIYVLHGHHLGISAARRAALYAEYRPQRRLPQRNNRILANAP